MADPQILPLFQSYLDENYIKDVPAKIKRNRKRFEDVLSPVEDWIMTVQSILVWENPAKSSLVFLIVNFGFWLTDSSRLIAVVAWGLLLLYMMYVWRVMVWPTIRVPSNIQGDDEWTPIHSDLMGVPEFSQYLAEYFVYFRVYVKALKAIRVKRKHAFLVLVWFVSAIVFVIGRYISGYMTIWLTVMAVLLWPAVIYHQFLPKVYMNLEPHMMRLQYYFRPQTEPGSSRCRRTSENGDTVETDSDNDDLPAVDPVLNATLAKAITDSEDENEAELRENRVPEIFGDSEEPSMIASLSPDVEHMPDHNDDESQMTFMLDDDVMPGLDDIDRSRLIHMPTQPIGGHETDSDAESLPFDESPKAPAVGSSANAHTSMEQMTSLISGMTEAMTAAMPMITEQLTQRLSAMSEASSTSQGPSKPATTMASLPPHLDDASESDSDFEILNKAELEESSPS